MSHLSPSLSRPRPVELHPVPGWTRILDQPDDDSLTRLMAWSSNCPQGTLILDAVEHTDRIQTELAFIPQADGQSQRHLLRRVLWDRSTGISLTLANAATRAILVARASEDAIATLTRVGFASIAHIIRRPSRTPLVMINCDLAREVAGIIEQEPSYISKPRHPDL